MKKLLTTIFSLCLAMSMAAPAFALEENISEPNGPNLVATSSTSLAPACRRELAHSAAAPPSIEPAALGFDGDLDVPQLRLQRIDDVPAAHEVDETAAEVPTDVLQLMLRVQADDRLAGLQQVFQQELQQEALALAGVAEDEDAAVGLVLATAVEIHNDVAPVAILADI